MTVTSPSFVMWVIGFVCESPSTVSARFSVVFPPAKKKTSLIDEIKREP